MSLKPRPDIVVGIDVGQTCTAVAYSIGPDWSEPRTINRWPGYYGVERADKVATRVGYSKQMQTVKNWGFESLFSDPSIELREQFKLTLDADFEDDRGYTSQDARKWYLDYLRCLHREIEKFFDSSIPRWRTMHVEYSFSTPTTWNNPAMVASIQKLIEEAGFSGTTRQSARMALTEAEAAAIEASTTQYQEGDIFLICDAGGGTTDVNLLKVMSTGQKIELSPLDHVGGVAIGSTLIDFHMSKHIVQRLQLIEEHLDGDIYCLAEEMLLGRFQVVKHSFPNPVVSHFYLEVKGLAGTHTFEEAGIEGSKMRIDRSVLIEIFDEQLEQIFALIDNRFLALEVERPTEQVSFIILSGGLGSSPYLYDRVKERYELNKGFRSKNTAMIRIMKVLEPQLAVGRGLVRERTQQLGSETKAARDVFTTRRCRNSYGLIVREQYDEAKHAGMQTLRHPLTGILQVPNCIEWFIQQGQEISVTDGICQGYSCSLTPEEQALPRFARIVMSTLPTDQLPRRYPHSGCKEVVNVVYYLTDNDLTVENRQTWNLKKKKKFWRAQFSFVVKLGPADLRFQIMGKNSLISSDHDSLSVEYMDPSERNTISNGSNPGTPKASRTPFVPFVPRIPGPDDRSSKGSSDPGAVLYLESDKESRGAIHAASVPVLPSFDHTEDTFTRIRQELSNCLQKNQQKYIFELAWQPFKFVRDQYPGVCNVTISRVLSLVGTTTRAQAITCGDYVAQTWPNVGPSLMECLDAWLSEDRTQDFSATKPCFTMRARSRHDDTVAIIIYAETKVLMEVGEVLAWLTIACRASTGLDDEQTLDLCTPKVEVVADGTCKFSVAAIRCDLETILEGGCWQDLFLHPSIAQGYPICPRVNSEPGLQIDIGLLSLLASTPRAFVIDKVVLLKGLFSMLVPTAKIGTSIVWHYIVNKDSTWISHGEIEKRGVTPITGVDIDQLEEATHFVGWTRKVHILAGSALADYKHIGFGGEPVDRGLAFDGVTIGFSRVISASVKALPGKKDMALIRKAAGPYEQMVAVAAQHHVVIYDTAARRAWLLDGATALLHLSRAALSHPRAPASANSLPKILKDSVALNPDQDSRYNAAQRVLLDDDNRKLVLYETKLRRGTTHIDDPNSWRFENLVEQNWSLFEEILAHQEKLKSAETKQWEMSNPLQTKRLRGFRFLDFISGVSILRPVQQTLGGSCKWLKVTLEAGAIHILGSDFGELMEPVSGRQTTLSCRGHPHDYLFAPVQRLFEIAERHGKIDPHSLKLCRHVYWNQPYRCFSIGPCECGIGSSSTGHDIDYCTKITFLDHFASELIGRAPCRHQLHRKYESGAVIIGTRSLWSRITALT